MQTMHDFYTWEDIFPNEFKFILQISMKVTLTESLGNQEKYATKTAFCVPVKRLRIQFIPVDQDVFEYNAP